MDSIQIGKQSILLFFVFILIQFTGWAQNTTAPYRMKSVVIDAGHGGRDPGNIGTGRYKTHEKDIALDVALRVGGYIKKEFPEINVIYTRSTDVFIGLDGRAEIANDAKADLFISIHCNSAANPAAYGVETFALGLHRNKENLEVAMKENSAIFLEDDYETKYEGFDPNSAESIIALTIMQSAYLQQSLSISAYVQKQFKERVGRRDRGVKQAGFLVLRKTTMPSILIELGFLTNPAEEDYLNSENGKAYMSSAIFRGFKEYKEIVEDPLPEGAVPKPAQKEVEKAADEKANKEAAQKIADQAKQKVVTDSLARAKQKQLDQKQKREADLAAKAQADKKAKLDSLEQVKLEKLAEYERRQKELAAEREKEIAEKKAQEKAAQKAEEERLKKELATKEKAKEWLEEIKEAKEEELEDAKQKAATDAEKERLLAIKKQKEQELAEAKRLSSQEVEKQQADSMAARKLIAEQARIDALAKERLAQETAVADSLEAALAAQKNREDSIKLAEIKKVQAEKEAMKEAALTEARRLAKQQATQDSIAAVRKAEADAIAVTINNKQAASAEEAELLFLQLRKKQLEQRIASLKSQNVEEVTEEKLEERASQKTVPEKVVDAAVVDGLWLKVQVVTSSVPLSLDSPQFKGQKAWQYQQGGLYKYTVGETQDFEEIVKLQGELRDLGFKGAFVVAFKDGERIKVSEARELLKR